MKKLKIVILLILITSSNQTNKDKTSDMSKIPLKFGNIVNVESNDSFHYPETCMIISPRGDVFLYSYMICFKLNVYFKEEQTNKKLYLKYENFYLSIAKQSSIKIEDTQAQRNKLFVYTLGYTNLDWVLGDNLTFNPLKLNRDQIALNKDYEVHFGEPNKINIANRYKRKSNIINIKIGFIIIKIVLENSYDIIKDSNEIDLYTSKTLRYQYNVEILDSKSEIVETENLNKFDQNVEKEFFQFLNNSFQNSIEIKKENEKELLLKEEEIDEMEKGLEELAKEFEEMAKNLPKEEKEEETILNKIFIPLDKKTEKEILENMKNLHSFEENFFAQLKENENKGNERKEKIEIEKEIEKEESKKENKKENNNSKGFILIGSISVSFIILGIIIGGLVYYFRYIKADKLFVPKVGK